MKTRSTRWHYLVIAILLALSLSGAASCVGGAPQVSFYDAGPSDLVATGSQFAQYFLYHFDTGASGRTFTLPSAADIVGVTSSPGVGVVFILGVTADGANAVTLQGGANVTVRPSAATVAAGTTKIIFYVFDNVGGGTEAVTFY